jgi:hypothetical protein
MAFGHFLLGTHNSIVMACGLCVKWPLGPVYTVEKSTGHEKKDISQLCLVENATLDRWVFTLGEENNGGELFSWMIK